MTNPRKRRRAASSKATKGSGTSPKQASSGGKSARSTKGPKKKKKIAKKKAKKSSTTSNMTPSTAPIADVTMASADDQTAVTKAKRKAELKAARAAKRAATEPINMAKALNFRNAALTTQTTDDVDMVTARRKVKKVDAVLDPAARVGDAVVVIEDLARPGMARHGGKANVTRVWGVGGRTRIDVRFIQCEGGGTETDIGVAKFTVLSHAHQDTTIAPRVRPFVDYTGQTAPLPAPSQQLPAIPNLSVVEALTRYYHRGKGWLRDECEGTVRPKRQTDAWRAERARGGAYYRELKAHQAAAARQTTQKAKRSGKFVSRKGKWSHGLPTSMKNLAWAWGVTGPNTLKGFAQVRLIL